MSEYSTPDAAAAVYGNDSWTIPVGTTTFDDGIQLSNSLFPVPAGWRDAEGRDGLSR